MNGYKNIIDLTYRTFSESCWNSIADILPAAKTFVKKHVPGMNYVYYVKGADGATIGHCFKEGSYMRLAIKN